MARILSFHAKIRDTGETEIFDKKKKIYSCEGLPILNDCLDGSYIDIEVDIDTGKIINWKKPTKKAWEEMMEDSDEDGDDGYNGLGWEDNGEDDNTNKKALDKEAKDNRDAENAFASVLNAVIANKKKELTKRKK